MLTNSVVGVLLAATCVVALGQQSVISFSAVPDGFQLAGSSHARPQIRVAANEYWGVVRAAGDLAKDFGRVTGTNFTLSNGAVGARSAAYEYRPAASNYTVVGCRALCIDLFWKVTQVRNLVLDKRHLVFLRAQLHGSGASRNCHNRGHPWTL